MMTWKMENGTLGLNSYLSAMLCKPVEFQRFLIYYGNQRVNDWSTYLLNDSEAAPKMATSSAPASTAALKP